MDPQQTQPVKLILSTAPDHLAAQQLAETLVERRLAACVNIVPGLTSIYRWQGAIERASEVLLVIKTTTAQSAATLAAIEELHPYDVPEAIVLPVEAGLANYLTWIQRSTGVECDSLSASDETL